jgi:hypothetical protein
MLWAEPAGEGDFEVEISMTHEESAEFGPSNQGRGEAWDSSRLCNLRVPSDDSQREASRRTSEKQRPSVTAPRSTAIG